MKNFSFIKQIVLVVPEMKFEDVLELRNGDGFTKQHCLHQQPQREDQEKRPQEVSLCHLLSVW